jgi:hypothetical protein
MKRKCEVVTTLEDMIESEAHIQPRDLLGACGDPVSPNPIPMKDDEIGSSSFSCSQPPEPNEPLADGSRAGESEPIANPSRRGSWGRNRERCRKAAVLADPA